MITKLQFFWSKIRLVDGSRSIMAAFIPRHLIRQIHFLSIYISNIKNVDDLVRFGCDFSNPDVQIAAIKRIGNTEEQTGKIIGEHFDDGKKTGTGIVHRDLMGFFVKPGFAVTVSAHLLFKGCGQVQFVGQCGPKVPSRSGSIFRLPVSDPVGV